MKKFTILLLFVAALISLTQCTNTAPDSSLSQADVRGKTISALMNNDAYMKEVMDSMQKKHGGDMASMALSNGDKQMQENTMNKMMDMCKADSTMCKKMMNTTMAMCDADSAMCKMMMTSMQEHPNMMKSMQGMGGMKGMMMEQKKK